VGIVNTSKLNSLQRDLPEGFLAPSSWLKEKSYSDQLLKKYKSSGWLESPVRGVYRRPGPALKWQHVVASLGHVLEAPAHVGGLSALELRGYAHFLKSAGPDEIHLYSEDNLPSWLTKLPLDERFVEHSNRLFANAKDLTNPLGSNITQAARSADALKHSLVEEAWGPSNWNIVYSAPERAILEALDDVPKRESVAHATSLMEGLADLSSRRVLGLLGACRSVKVKRLFLALASRQRHQWVQHVVEAAERGEVDIGKGKRALIPEGKLDPKYLITLPDR
jgi:hypothetical protein